MMEKDTSFGKELEIDPSHLKDIRMKKNMKTTLFIQIYSGSLKIKKIDPKCLLDFLELY
jgi:hypothetical protein